MDDGPTPPDTKSPNANEPGAHGDVNRIMAQEDGSKIMLRFMGGDARAFRELVEQYQEEMLNYFFRLSGDRYAAEDMTQELFLKVFRFRDRYEPRASFRSFIYSMARNLWIDRYRKKRVRPRVTSLDAGWGRRREARMEFPDERTPGPPQDAVRKERVERLAAALDRLPEAQREVLVLCLQGKFRYAEIAEIMDIPLGTVKSRVHAAVARLRELMGEE